MFQTAQTLTARKTPSTRRSSREEEQSSLETDSEHRKISIMGHTITTKTTMRRTSCTA